MAFIGQLFVEAGLIDGQQLAEGLRAQAVYGGRLGTNLVELGYIDEASLHIFLSRQLGVPALSTDAQPSAEALACLHAEDCARLDVLPLRIQTNTLLVAALDPNKPDLRPLLQQLAGRPIAMQVASEGRLLALMREFLGIERAPRLAVVAAEAQRAGHAALQDAPLHSILRDQAFAANSVPAGEDDEVLLLDIVVDEGALGDPVAEVGELDFNFQVDTSDIAIQAAPGRGSDEVVQRVHGHLPASLQPLPFEEALPRVASCADREELARIVLRYALWSYRRALLFTVQRGLVLGWNGLGDRVDRDLAQKLMIPLSAPSIFARVCQSQRPYRGAVESTPLNDLFYKILGDVWPPSCQLVPFVVGARVVAVLYADQPLREINDAADSELGILSIQVRRAFERFINQQQAPAL